jgi:hypothetical protein
MTRHTFTITPAGIGPATVGITRADLHAALGPPDNVQAETDRWFENALRVDFDEHGAEFIEVHCGAPFDVRVGDTDPFGDLTNEQLEDLLVPDFGPLVVCETGTLWIFPMTQLAVVPEVGTGTIAIARPGYHDSTVSGKVETRTVLVVAPIADDDLELVKAQEEVHDLLRGLALASWVEWDVVATFEKPADAISALAQLRSQLGAEKQFRAGIDVGPTFIGAGRIEGSAVTLARRMSALRHTLPLVSEAARGDLAVGEPIEFPVRAPRRPRKGMPPSPPGRLARAFPVS